MLQVRRAAERGHANHGWLDTHHTFSFADYHDPRFMGFRSLRVINEDRVAGGQGFGRHPHRDMEIVTYVLDGALAHQDSTGGGGTIRHGDVQRMSAGTGVVHSEFNASQTEAAHFLQIWLMPAEAGIQPSYEEKHFPAAERTGQLRLIVSPDGAQGSLRIHQDARIHAGTLQQQTVTVPLAAGRHAWVQVARGSLSVNGQVVQAGDGVAISDDTAIRLDVPGQAEVLVFDLA
jgi:redox-sensitive bicupin YhaK (pirin superfamily)